MSTAVASIVTSSSETTSAIDTDREQQQVCGLDETQIDILTETWKQVDEEEKKQQVGIVLFKRLDIIRFIVITFG